MNIWITNYKLDSDIYKNNSQTSWYTYKRHLSISKKHFQVKDDYLSYLSDAGAKLYHPKKESIYLEDIFILSYTKKSNSH